MNAHTSEQSSDEELILAIAAGQTQQESELIEKYQKRLVAFCCARSDRTRGYDLAQQVWVKLLPKLRAGKYHGKNVMALLCQTARNLVIDHSRRRSENSSSLDDHPIEPASTQSLTPLSQLLEAEELAALVDCKQLLLTQEIAVLDWNDQAPELESITKPQIYKMRHLAIRKLRDCVQQKLDRGAS